MKPTVKLSGLSDISSIIATMTQSLKEQDLFKQAQDFSRKVMDCHTYDSVLELCFKYADIE